MTAIINSAQVRQIQYGIKVERATAVLPATAYGALFTVSGGRILVTGLVGEVTVVCSGTATNLKVTATPTTGTAVDVAANVAVTSKEVGTLIGITGLFSDAAVASNAGATVMPRNGVVVPIGTLGITTSATNTGSVKWTLLYVALDDAATVVAA
jgi:hypothetical protein